MGYRTKPFNAEAYEQALRQECGERYPRETVHRQVRYRPLYHQGDVDDLTWRDSQPGEHPFVRGPRASMYTHRPWTIRQYAGFSTAEESNAFYRDSLAAGQRGLSVAFDLATHRGYDSDDPRVRGDVGQAGVAIDSVEDLSRLFDGIPLGDISVSMTMNGAVLPIMAAYIVVAREQGVAPERLSGTLQNDILKEFIVRNTFIYPPAPSMRIVADIIAYCSQYLPRFNPVSISGYHMQEAGATPVQELAFTLADGLEYVESALKVGLSIDDFAPRLSFFFGVGMDFLAEVAKLRAARLLWAELLAERYRPRSPASLRLRMHCQTSGVSLTAQDPLNNAVRTTIEALAAVLGGTQSLHTNAYDEALALPSDDAARLARNTQLLIQHETDLCRVVDPLGGAYAIEALTHQLCQSARQLIGEIDELGGMVMAIEQGWVQAQIERAAVQRQVALERGTEHLIGVNLYPRPERPELVLRRVDPEAVLRAQRERLEALKRTRDANEVKHRLQALEQAARDPRGNLLEHTIECMAARATVGEVSACLEQVWGRHTPTPSLSGGVFAAAFEEDAAWRALRERAQHFERQQGRRPRMLVSKLGQDGHDRGAKVIASGFADAGFDVDLGPLFQTPAEAAGMAVDSDVHVIGVSTQAGAHQVLVPQLLDELRALGATDVLVVCGGIIPEADHAALRALGVAELFEPGASVVACAARVLELLEQRFAAR